MNKIIVTLVNNNDSTKLISYSIKPLDNPLARDWIKVFEDDIIENKLLLRQNYCFMGFPGTYRNFDYLCDILNQSIERINSYNPTWIEAGLKPYFINEFYTKETVVDPNSLIENQENLNRLHNHFEILRETVS